MAAPTVQRARSSPKTPIAVGLGLAAVLAAALAQRELGWRWTDEGQAGVCAERRGGVSAETPGLSELERARVLRGWGEGRARRRAGGGPIVPDTPSATRRGIGRAHGPRIAVDVAGGSSRALLHAGFRTATRPPGSIPRPARPSHTATAKVRWRTDAGVVRSIMGRQTSKEGADMTDNIAELRAQLRDAESKVRTTDDALKDLKGSRVKLALGSAAAGFLLFAIGGQWFPGYQLDSTAANTANELAATAVSGVMAELCAERFMNSAGLDARLADLKQASGNWNKATYIQQGAWARPPGGGSANHSTAEKCRALIATKVAGGGDQSS